MLLTAAGVVLPPTESAAVLYGTIHAELAMSGTPVPQNGTRIPAVAWEHELFLATNPFHWVDFDRAKSSLKGSSVARSVFRHSKLLRMAAASKGPSKSNVRLINQTS